MKSNDGTLVYNTHPVVSELNRVKGFDPLRFLKQTAEGPKMELKYKKLWFRLKHPNGRIKVSALKITEQMAIIEARIFFEKSDTEPNAVFTATSDLKTAPGGLYIEAAQHMATDQALTDAGFGIQFVPDRKDATPVVVPSTEVKTVPARNEEKPVPDAPKSAVEAAEKDATKNAVATPIAASPAIVKPENAVPDAVAVPEVVAPPVPVAPAASRTPVQEAPGPQPGGYTNSMTVDEICARMTLEDAENYIVPLGTCNGQTMKQVADRRPASLRYYMNGYSGDNNILRAAATVVSRDRLQKAG